MNPYHSYALERWVWHAWADGKISQKMWEFSFVDPYFAENYPLLPMWAASRGFPDGYAKCPHCRWVLRITAKQVQHYILEIARGHHINCDTCSYWVVVVAFIEMEPREVNREVPYRAWPFKKEK